ncbi:cytochrome c [Chryseolinea sp. T2]|uniref:c-type cytochrome n=1 Tax=Chryseolinea sp. T2 TaxID=3129255 RepID=UPI0030789CA6
MKKLIIIAGCIVVMTTVVAFKPVQKFDLKASIERGKEVYTVQCITCHMEQGEGIEGVYPPLSKSDYLMGDKKRSVDQVLHGLTGEIKVNGKTYDGVMTGFDALSDTEVSDVLNYVRNSFGNKGAAVTPEEVKALRK